MDLPRGIKTFRKLLHASLALALLGCAPDGQSATSCRQPDLAFAGDVLLHALIQSDADGRADGFGPAFDAITPALSRARMTVLNLEGPTARNIAPSGASAPDPGRLFDGNVYSGYPRFNYHPSIAGVLRNAGVDVVQTANNHALDRGANGVRLTLQALAASGLSTTGTRPAPSEGTWHVERQVNGRNVALVACTYSTNGLSNSRNLVLGCYNNTPSIPNLIHSLSNRPEIDAVVLLPHWGTEYSARPTARQRRLAQAVADAGAAAIIGAHPHVLQPIETLVAQDGRPVPVAYSLGNLISSQWALPRRTGAILYLDLVRDDAGRTLASNPRVLPTRVERFAETGVAVAPAATLPTGQPSLAHARALFGDLLVGPDGC